MGGHDSGGYAGRPQRWHAPPPLPPQRASARDELTSGRYPVCRNMLVADPAGMSALVVDLVVWSRWGGVAGAMADLAVWL